MSGRDEFGTDPETVTVVESSGAGATPATGPTVDLALVAPGTRVNDRYLLLDVLGKGGMGTVFRAHDSELDEVVALKMLHVLGARRQRAEERFRREIKLARRVTHHNVARVYEFGHHRDVAYLTMEYIAGESLADTLTRTGPLSVEHVAAIVTEVCAGLEAAHRVGVIHRDIKPSNILLGEDRRVAITDFGIAVSPMGDGADDDDGKQLVGTPAFMAPEQVVADPPTAQTDIFALGATIYALVTGSIPWRGSSARQVAYARLTEAPIDPCLEAENLPRAVGDLILHCLRLDPLMRPNSVAQVADMMRRAVTTAQVTWPQYRPRPGLSAETLAELHRPVVAVLPFVNRGAAGDEFLAQGVTMALNDSLSRVGGLRVLSGVLSDPARAREAPALARELGAEFSVGGALARLGTQLRIEVQLRHVPTDTLRWRHNVASKPESFFALHDQLAGAIADHLQVQPARQHSAMDLDATGIELYLRACNARRLYHLHEAEALLDEALARAPKHPKLLSLLAMVYTARLFFDSTPQPEILVRARRCVRRAREYAPELGESYLAQAYQYLHEGHPVRAVHSLRLAVHRAPSLVLAHGLIGELLCESGRVDDGLRRVDAAVALDRNYLIGYYVRARVLTLRGDSGYKQAIADMLAMQGEDRWWLGEMRLHYWRRDHERLAEMDDELSAAMANPNVSSGRVLDWRGVNCYLGRTTPAETIGSIETAAASTLSARRQCLFWQSGAEFACEAGEYDQAAAWLSRALTVGLVDVLWLDSCPLLAPLRKRADFARVRAEVQRRADALIEAVWSRAQQPAAV